MAMGGLRPEQHHHPGELAARRAQSSDRGGGCGRGGAHRTDRHVPIAGQNIHSTTSKKGAAMKHKSRGSIIVGMIALAMVGSTAVHAQEKYSLKSPSGIAFSDFKGYEDWAVVSSARTDEVLKVIV